MSLFDSHQTTGLPSLVHEGILLTCVISTNCCHRENKNATHARKKHLGNEQICRKSSQKKKTFTGSFAQVALAMRFKKNSLPDEWIPR